MRREPEGGLGPAPGETYSFKKRQGRSKLHFPFFLCDSSFGESYEHAFCSKTL